MQKMLLKNNIDWNDCNTWQKRGWCVTRKVEQKSGQMRTVIEPDWDVPVFSRDREYINKHIIQAEG